ncbi:hypothetical protein TNCV_789141 [Trichonephila clavipes]|nr:hypothetical protein TNCV_789141 [Trichonephila clavipes]
MRETYFPRALIHRRHGIWVRSTTVKEEGMGGGEGLSEFFFFVLHRVLRGRKGKAIRNFRKSEDEWPESNARAIAMVLVILNHGQETMTNLSRYTTLLTLTPRQWKTLSNDKFNVHQDLYTCPMLNRHYAQTPMPSLGFKPYGTGISIANHYTRGGGARGLEAACGLQVGTIDKYSACVEVGTIDKYSACVEVGTHRRKFRLCRGWNHSHKHLRRGVNSNNFNYITCEEVKSVESKFFFNYWIHRTCEQQGS